MIENDSGADARRIERLALMLSPIGYLVFGILGIVFAIAAHSDAIMLDGVYSLVSVVLALLSAKVARLVELPDSEHFPFGYALFEPLTNTFRVLIILGVDAFAAFSAVDALVSGGRTLVPGLAVIYGILSTVACLVMAVVQGRLARRARSPILKVDARNWFVDGMISSSVALAFILAYFLQGTSLAHWIPFVDPVLVLAIVAATLPVPIRSLRENLPQVVYAAPGSGLQRRVREVVYGELDQFAPPSISVRMVEVGRLFYVLIHVLVSEDVEALPVDESDRRREEIQRRLSAIGLRAEVDLVFTRNTDDVLSGPGMMSADDGGEAPVAVPSPPGVE